MGIQEMKNKIKSRNRERAEKLFERLTEVTNRELRTLFQAIRNDPTNQELLDKLKSTYEKVTARAGTTGGNNGRKIRNFVRDNNLNLGGEESQDQPSDSEENPEDAEETSTGEDSPEESREKAIDLYGAVRDAANKITAQSDRPVKAWQDIAKLLNRLAGLSNANAEKTSDTGQRQEIAEGDTKNEKT